MAPKDTYCYNEVIGVRLQDCVGIILEATTLGFMFREYIWLVRAFHYYMLTRLDPKPYFDPEFTNIQVIYPP